MPNIAFRSAVVAAIVILDVLGPARTTGSSP